MRSTQQREACGPAGQRGGERPARLAQQQAKGKQQGEGPRPLAAPAAFARKSGPLHPRKPHQPLQQERRHHRAEGVRVLEQPAEPGTGRRNGRICGA
ncbi:hypothetical protein D3C81_1260610 [compost metagenome]